MIETLQKLALQEAQENRAQNARSTYLLLLLAKLELRKAMKKAGDDY